MENELIVACEPPKNRIKIRLTGNEWKEIEDLASDNNVKNVKKFIIRKAKELQRMNRHIVCPKEEELLEKEIYLPKEVSAFYEHLSLCYGIKKSTLIFRLIILPMLIKGPKQQESGPVILGSAQPS